MNATTKLRLFDSIANDITNLPKMHKSQNDLKVIFDNCGKLQ